MIQYSKSLNPGLGQAQRRGKEICPLARAKTKWRQQSCHIAAVQPHNRAPFFAQAKGHLFLPRRCAWPRPGFKLLEYYIIL